MGSNMAEQHPVGFQWVMKAKERGARFIHVDPRFTRTSAMADRHISIRAGTDIAFLGGVVNYIFEHDAWFEEYVRHFTNGPVLIREDYVDAEDAAGMFSGWDSDNDAYEIESWGYDETSHEAAGGKKEQQGDVSGEQAHGAHGMKLEGGNPPNIDNSMQDPRCVLQILKRHFARYTPEVVADICGCSPEHVDPGRPGAVRELRPGADLGDRVLGRLDPAHDRRPEHPHRVDHPAAAREHGASRRRHPGAPRTRQHPGLDGHPDALQHPPGLHPDAPPDGRAATWTSSSS